MTEPFAAAGSPGRVEVRGDIDMAVATKVRDAVSAPEVTGGQDTVFIDVARVTFIDSSGLSALVEARSALEAQGIAMRLQNPPPPVRRILEVVGLTEILLGEASSLD